MIIQNKVSLPFIRYFLVLFSCCLVMAPFARAADDYQTGRSAYISGDHQRAYAILKPLAEAGDPESQKILAIMYDYGHGVKADPKKALEWFKRSAEQGQPAVQYQVGTKYFRGSGVEQDHAEAAMWWELAANGGQVDAQFNLGLMYYRGLDIEPDNSKAAELFQLAAEQGHGHAQYSLAVMYSFGHGVEKDYRKALKWFSQSAEQGVAQAQFNMGVFYENGLVVKKNLQTARKWYERAMAQGLAQANKKLQALDTGDTKTTQETLADYTIDEIQPDGIKREDWVIRQNPKTYTLQIVSLVKEANIIRFIEENQLDSDAAYIEVVINNVKRYNAFYGSYDNFEQAQQAIKDLPDNLRKTKPWIRNFGVLQQMLN